ncbi:MAG: Nif3-like dinuclear metal center hexameric protein [Eubacteriaceae bacterium]|nr:Nif3-like dinuclear metal center hexameric protein [Eubacteriaceae bacterium]
MKIREIIEYINTFANEKYQYPWDNTGLQVGDPDSDITGILVCLDCLEDVVDEAIKNNCNLIISHHPMLFSGVKRISDDYKSNLIKKLIRNDITVYSSHTAFDVCESGMNNYVASALGLKNIRPLDDLSDMKCFFTACVDIADLPRTEDMLREMNVEYNIFESGTKAVVDGVTFRSLFGKISSKLAKISSDASITSSGISSTTSPVGLGIIGELPEKRPASELTWELKKIFECTTLRASRNYKDKKVKTIAVCTGSGSDYLKASMRMGADMYICADLKWNDFLTCEESGLAAVCPTHFESEKSFISIMASKLKEFNASLSILKSKSEDVESFL